MSCASRPEGGPTTAARRPGTSRGSGRRLRVLVCGRLAASPYAGGAAWATLQWVLGLRDLGHDIYFAEPLPADRIEPADASLGRSKSAAAFRRIMAEFGLGARSSLFIPDSDEHVGLSRVDLRSAARRADVLINLSGVLRDDAILTAIPTRVYVDLDPGFTQLWHEAQGIDMGISGHTHHATVGLALGDADCPIPTCGVHWIPVLPPVALYHWPRALRVVRHSFTSVGHWRGYGSIHHGGVHYGQRAHSTRQIMGLPSRAPAPIELAMAVHPGDAADLRALRDGGWRLLDPGLASTRSSYRRFIADSMAELCIAKSGYVVGRTGWFSDRSACYLASGRPVVAQETGFSRYLPVGEGLLAFTDEAGAAAAMTRVMEDYDRHAGAARSLAEDHLDARRVCGRVLRAVGVAS